MSRTNLTDSPEYAGMLQCYNIWDRYYKDQTSSEAFEVRKDYEMAKRRFQECFMSYKGLCFDLYFFTNEDNLKKDWIFDKQKRGELYPLRNNYNPHVCVAPYNGRYGWCTGCVQPCVELAISKLGYSPIMAGRPGPLIKLYVDNKFFHEVNGRFYVKYSVFMNEYLKTNLNKKQFDMFYGNRDFTRYSFIEVGFWYKELAGVPSFNPHTNKQELSYGDTYDLKINYLP